MARVAIIGSFGGERVLYDGQTVKTVTLYRALSKRDVVKVHCVDTSYIKQRPLKFLVQFVIMFLFYKKIIVMVSINGRRVLFPILYLLAKLGKEVYHYAIGGRLAREVERNSQYRKYVMSFQGNWMESTELVDNLQRLGVTNAVYIPNFKTLTILAEKDLCRDYHRPYRLCTFSRVMEEKGIEDAIRAVSEINRKRQSKVVELDIYGPVEEGFANRFDMLVKENPDCRYCGVVSPNESVEVLKDYYALLFPTHYRHEGIPGTIIDALSAGVPIISRRWQYCDEMLQHGETGYVYDFDEPESILPTIEYAIDHVSATVGMKQNCLNKAKEYSDECVIARILELMHIG